MSGRYLEQITRRGPDKNWDILTCFTRYLFGSPTLATHFHRYTLIQYFHRRNKPLKKFMFTFKVDYPRKHQQWACKQYTWQWKAFSREFINKIQQITTSIYQMLLYINTMDICLPYGQNIIMVVTILYLWIHMIFSLSTVLPCEWFYITTTIDGNPPQFNLRDWNGKEFICPSL